jgi:hypothetical protein
MTPKRTTAKRREKVIRKRGRIESKRGEDKAPLKVRNTIPDMCTQRA